MNEKVIIYKDIEGNYDTDTYYKKEDLEDLKEFLRKRGVKEIDVIDNDVSIERHREFVPDKPRVMRRDTKKIDWLNINVITELLCSKEQDDYEKTKKLCELSGFDISRLPESEQPQGFIAPRYSQFSKLYEKWKRENKIIEHPDSKETLVRQFAAKFIEDEKKKKKRQVEVGVKVLVTKDNEVTVVKQFDPDTNKYILEHSDGAISIHKRNEFEVV